MQDTHDYSPHEGNRYDKNYEEYLRQHRLYEAECRRLEQHGYYGSAALKRALTP